MIAMLEEIVYKLTVYRDPLQIRVTWLVRAGTMFSWPQKGA